MFAYVGGYSGANRNGQSPGLSVFQTNAPGAAWTAVQTLACYENPSFLRLHPNGQTLYAAHGGHSMMSAYAIDAASGRLSLLNEMPCGGLNPVDFGFDRAARHIVVANYGAGNVVLLPIGGDGGLLQPLDVVALSGAPGPHPTEQPGPRPHGVTFDPSGAYAIIPDKGVDRVWVFRPTQAGLELAGAAEAASGAGPRHAVFHPTLPMLFVVNELDCTVQSYHWNAARAELQPVQSLSTLPADDQTASTGSEIAISAAGDCLYVSNRGHDSIARFRVDPTSGALSFQDCTPVQGQEPRFFALDPGGLQLHVANQNSHDIVSFMIDPASGRLHAPWISAQIGSPTAICFR